MSICNVCCETYNKSVNSKIICPISSCSYDACKRCVRTYLLNTTNDPHCMNCRNKWDTKFMVDNLNRSYMDTNYKKHRKNLLVDREISRTPELMHLVERTKLIDEKSKELIVLFNQYNEIKKTFYTLGRQLSDKRNEINKIKNGDLQVEKKKFIMPCPGENCKGYLSSQYKCEICKLFTCPDCFEVIGYNKTDEHTCLDDNLKSAEMIKKETKGCPKCGVRIFKISGCDQMWCTECRVAFSWNTGKIDYTGTIHNPEFYRYMRENGGNGQNAPRNPGDILCGGLINYYTLNSLVRYVTGISTSSFKYINKLNELVYDNEFKDLVCLTDVLFRLHQIVNHITNIDLRNTRQKVNDLVNFDSLTVQYILNNITKEQLATSIFRNDNLRKKYVELMNIYEFLSVIAIERFANLYQEFQKNIKVFHDYKNLNINCISEFIMKIINFIKEYNNLIKYANKQLVTISYTYNQSVSIINYDNYIYNYKRGKFKQSDLSKIEKAEKLEKESQASCSYH